jgi:sugar transferase EpsL
MTIRTTEMVKRKSKWGYIPKRIIEFTAAALMLTALLPLFAVIAGFIKVESKGPVFFTQTRGGKDNIHFTIYKFRTMSDDPTLRNDELEVLATDARITKAGHVLRKYSLDELPQLINIIRGEMSFVGPRPTLTSQTDRYDAHQMQRLLVKPGVTGWAQVSGRNSLSWREKIELDIEYIQRQSARFDIYILMLTVLKVFKSEGVYGDS